ncbi:hypothetical protein Tco_0868030 [Tanacetum coccineum]
MSNTNNNLQTQTSNSLHNVIMEAGGKDHPPMLALALKTPTTPSSNGDALTRPKRVKESYAIVPKDINNKLITEAKAVQIILIRIDNDIYSIVDVCLNAMEMFYKMMNGIVRNQCIVTNHQVNVQFLLQLKPGWQRFVTIVKQNQDLKNVSYHKLYDILKQHQNEVSEIRAERLARNANPLALVTGQYENRRAINVVGARENVGTQVVQQTRIQCYKYKEFGYVARECKKPKRARESVYHKEKMLLCKQEEAKIQLSAKQADWMDDTNDEHEDQELEAHYMYMSKIQEVLPDVAEKSGPNFDVEPLQKVHTYDENYNVFANDRQHPKQPESINDTYMMEKDDRDTIYDSSNMYSDEVEADHDDDLAKERDLLAFLIDQLKSEIDDKKTRIGV